MQFYSRFSFCPDSPVVTSPWPTTITHSCLSHPFQCSCPPLWGGPGEETKALKVMHSPYFTCAMSPTTISATGIWMTCPPRTTVNFCSCSMRLCSPRNCFSLLQSLKAVTRTTQMTDRRMAAPSIQPASASPSSSAPPVAVPHPAETLGTSLGGVYLKK